MFIPKRNSHSIYTESNLQNHDKNRLNNWQCNFKRADIKMEKVEHHFIDDEKKHAAINWASKHFDRHSTDKKNRQKPAVH